MCYYSFCLLCIMIMDFLQLSHRYNFKSEKSSSHSITMGYSFYNCRCHVAKILDLYSSIVIITCKCQHLNDYYMKQWMVFQLGNSTNIIHVIMTLNSQNDQLIDVQHDMINSALIFLWIKSHIIGLTLCQSLSVANEIYCLINLDP